MRCTSCGRDVSRFDDARFCPFCGGSLVAAVRGDGWIGRTIAGRFTIVGHLAEGGIGRVYLAEQPMGHTKRRLALKMLLPEHASDPEMVSRFLRECELVSLIEHPNVVRIYDFGEAEPGIFYIAMELVPGKSFAAVLHEEGPLPVADGIELLSQVCRGIAAAHDRGIVHRDLKPDNLMLVRLPGEPALVKVLDFGIAKAVGASMAGAGGVTRMGVIVGSPAYMSPEQFLGEANDVRADLYAIGVVAYEMLTGARPFEATEMTDWATQHINAVPRAFDTTPAGARVPEALRRTILRAMAKAKGERPSSARALMTELRASVEDTASHALAPGAGATIAAHPVDGALEPSPPPLPAPGPLRSRAMGWRLVVLSAAAVAAVAAGAAGVAVAVARGSSPHGPTADAAPSTGPTEATPAEDASAQPPEQDASLVEPPFEPLEPLSAAPPARSSTPPSHVPVDASACERSLRATTCTEARNEVHHCPDAAGKIHHLAHEHVARLCAEHPHE